MKFSEIHGNKALAENLVKMVDTKRLGHAILFSEQEGQGALAFAIALSQYINCSNPSGGDSCGECLSCRKHYRLTHPDLHFAFPVNASNFLSDSEKKKPVSSYFMTQWNELVQRNPYFTPGELSNALGLTGKVGNISVNEAREISDALALHSSESDYKVMIIWQAEKMNAEASNKLLKLLEEPPAGTLFILITQQSEQLLQTIRSRCQLIPLQPVQQGEMAEELTAALGMDKAEAMEVAALSSGSWGKA
ncbi:MAG: DNA polymerase III subunit delta', partial [Bacteroidales bacterium]|nr:DNA polymerase III subunit delta' [Bacteroidales bacterium]